MKDFRHTGLTQQAAHRKDAGKIADMPHRHFATIATIISRLELSAYAAPTEVVRADIAKQFALRADIAKQFADELAHTNAKFDRDRFLRACQP